MVRSKRTSNLRTERGGEGECVRGMSGGLGVGDGTWTRGHNNKSKSKLKTENVQLIDLGNCFLGVEEGKRFVLVDGGWAFGKGVVRGMVS